MYKKGYFFLIYVHFNSIVIDLIINFVKPVHIYISQLFFDDTITIHSVSAGIGRTGTYIAFDGLCKEGKSKGTINVASYVKVMRSCRMNMVQNYVSFNHTYEHVMDSITLAISSNLPVTVRV